MEASTIDLTSAKDVYMTKVPLKSGGYEPRDDEGNLLHQPEKIPRVGFFHSICMPSYANLCPFSALIEDYVMVRTVYHIYISYIQYVLLHDCTLNHDSLLAPVHHWHLPDWWNHPLRLDDHWVVMYNNHHYSSMVKQTKQYCLY